MFFVVPLLITTPVVGQALIPLERLTTLEMEYAMGQQLIRGNAAIKPFLTSTPETFRLLDSLKLSGTRPPRGKASWIKRKLFSEHFLKVDSSAFSIAVDPLLDLQAGYDAGNAGFVYRNSRGVQIQGHLKNKLAFYTAYLESQARFPSWINTFIKNYEVVPGNNRVKDFKDKAYDYGAATANLSYSPWRFLNVQLGYGKNMFGYGYRSLLLSDNAFQYPFLKVTTRLGRFEYVNLVTSFQNLDSDSLLNAPYIWYHGYQKKGGTFNYLSVHLTEWLDAGLFEGILWTSRGLREGGFNINQYLPVIFVNTLRYGLFGENNAVIGADVQARLLKNLRLYGQFALDDLHVKKPVSGSAYQKTKIGYQLGLKYFDVAGIRNLHLQAEYNEVRPYTYGHPNVLQSYTHYNQALAHPLGGNFREVLGFLNYRYRRWQTSLQYMHAVSGADSAGTHWGSNIFYPDTYASNGYNSAGNEILQGQRCVRNLAVLRISWLANPTYNLCIEADVTYRHLNTAGAKTQNLCFSLGLKTRLFNQYTDF